MGRVGGDDGVDRLAGDPRRGQVDRPHLLGQAVVGQGDRGAGEAVGLDDVRAGLEEAAVDGPDHVGARHGQDVAAAGQGVAVVAVAIAAEVVLAEAVGLDHGAHGPVHDENAAGEGFPQALGSVHGHVSTIGWRAP